MLFRIESENISGAIILRCNGALVHGEPSTMLLHAGEKHSAHQLVVDLTGVDAVDASGLGALVGLEKWARNTGMRVRLLNPSKYLRGNLVNTLNLLDAMVETGVRDIVFSSTAAVYGVPAHVPIREDHPLVPVNPYGESKLAVERALAAYETAHAAD